MSWAKATNHKEGPCVSPALPIFSVLYIDAVGVLSATAASVVSCGSIPRVAVGLLMVMAGLN